MKNSHLTAVIIINLLTFLISVSYEMVFTVLPFFLVNTIGVSMVIIGLIEGGYDLITNFVKIFSGYWSDFFSKRKILFISILFSIISRFYFIFGKKWDDMLIAVSSEAVSEGIQVPVSDTILSSEKKEKLGRIFGINRTVEGVGSFIGIVIAFIYTLYFLESTPYQTYFYFSIIPLVISLFLIFFLKEKKKVRTYHIPIVSWEVFFPKYLILFFILSFANFGYSFYILKIYGDNLSETETIGVYIIFSVIIAAASYISGKFYDRFGEKRFLEITSILFFVSHLLMINLPVAGFIIFAFADAFLEIGTWATIGRKVKFRKGFVFGTYHFTVGFSSLIAGLMAGYFWDSIGAEAPFIMGTVASIVAFFAIRRYF
ncbi:Major Facilitator Superfamily protein [Persephonella hydrogeniphila]|uniref:Major Facilitator Superfamily protein n=1 Tax=Persephonella hydrogeniphila TaxID=198703 RepID=A0A285NRZ4_9AQUI|nr:MFS transporter [Persephonella hydrogeniphila]SNZ11703.1 Major Facilitator Superfamily protein [Persephonella hydrogeniphila]